MSEEEDRRVTADDENARNHDASANAVNDPNIESHGNGDVPVDDAAPQSGKTDEADNDGHESKSETGSQESPEQGDSHAGEGADQGEGRQVFEGISWPVEHAKENKNEGSPDKKSDPCKVNCSGRIIIGIIALIISLAFTVWAACKGLLFNGGADAATAASIEVFIIDCGALIAFVIALFCFFLRSVPLRYLIILVPFVLGIIGVLAALRTTNLTWSQTIVYMGLCFFLIKLVSDSIVDLLKIRDSHVQKETDGAQRSEGIDAEFHVSGRIAAPSSSNVGVNLTGKIDNRTGTTGTSAAASRMSSIGASNAGNNVQQQPVPSNVGAHNSIDSDAQSASGNTHVHMSNTVNDHDLNSAVDSVAKGTERVSMVVASSRIGRDVPSSSIESNEQTVKFAGGINTLIQQVSSITADDVEKASSIGMRLALVFFLLVLITTYPEVAVDVATDLQAIFK
ncbi:hypothetical protein JS533_009210 [Bifidobacterium amazonense]|uniref:Uncharacterized protein n=1 Tax=Bifidobacterium amazonense TaxID=2809027 RepID=A0ABS9VWZ2_9BIFI|nr:hypothetical protein [Bifidobacterium amazonense]MCH9276441.1 hypothetical protein [Bifidobacterium amazonense]